MENALESPDLDAEYGVRRAVKAANKLRDLIRCVRPSVCCRIEACSNYPGHSVWSEGAPPGRRLLARPATTVWMRTASVKQPGLRSAG